MAKSTATLTDNETGKTYEMPIIHGTMGPRLVDVRKFYGDSGMFTYDPGFTSTGSCGSKITYIDGDEGLLLHRGYNISELAEQSDFMEVAYLLMKGELPNKAQKDKFVKDITNHTMVHEQLSQFYRGFRRDAHPMAICCGVVGALSAFYHDSLDIHDPHQRMVASYRLVAKMPTIAAMAYKYSVGQPFVYPRNDLSYAANFLRMMFSVPAEEYEVNPIVEKAMDRILMLHADHEQNASTSTVRLAGSSGANRSPASPPASPRCGARAMAARTKPSSTCCTRSAASRNPGLPVPREGQGRPHPPDGLRHRVYKNYDPRAKVMRQTCHEVLTSLGITHDPLLELAMEMEQIALKDDYFVSKKLYPNVDFYSGIIFRAIGIPTSMFTVLFAVARTVGWISQWNEMIEDPDQKIGRPRQLYNGQTERPYKPLHMRG